MTREIWENEFALEKSEFEGRELIRVFPPEGTANGRWMLKTEYFGAFPELEKRLLKLGYGLFYLKNINRYGTDADTDSKARLAAHLHSTLGFSGKCVPVGMSCRGMQAVFLAARHPECVSVMYLDAPVMNFLSWPFGFGSGNGGGRKAQEELLSAYGLDTAGLLAFRGHPLDVIPSIVRHKIPTALVYGESDSEVPYEENGALLKKALREAGTELALFGKPGCGHHPHGLEDPSPLIDFILAHDKD